MVHDGLMVAKRGSTTVVAMVAVWALNVGLARGAEPGPMPGPGSDTVGGRAAARRLFDQGQAHYALGEYDEAIARFRDAYDLTQAPPLLFNIAQAHRLAGHCGQALEIYRHFVRLDPSSPYRSEAETQIDLLKVSCAPPLLAAPPPRLTADRPPALRAISSSQPPSMELPRDGVRRWPARARVAVGLLLGGVAVGAAAGIVYHWNSGRYDQWAVQDRQLAAGVPPESSLGAWAARQNSNDALLTSIRRDDWLVTGLAAASATCLLSSAVAALMSIVSSPAPTAAGDHKVSMRH